MTIDDVAAEHDARVRRARARSTSGDAPMTPSSSRRRRAAGDAEHDRHARPSRMPCAAACAAPSRSRSPVRRATIARRDDRQPHRDRVDEREPRFGEADGRDGGRAELGDEEHVADGEHALHDHLEHHRNGEDEDRARDGAFGVVAVRAAQRFADGVPRSRRARARVRRPPRRVSPRWTQRSAVESDIDELTMNLVVWSPRRGGGRLGAEIERAAPIAAPPSRHTRACIARSVPVGRAGDDEADRRVAHDGRRRSIASVVDGCRWSSQY